MTTQILSHATRRLNDESLEIIVVLPKAAVSPESKPVRASEWRNWDDDQEARWKASWGQEIAP